MFLGRVLICCGHSPNTLKKLAQSNLKGAVALHNKPFDRTHMHVLLYPCIHPLCVFSCVSMHSQFQTKYIHNILHSLLTLFPQARIVIYKSIMKSLHFHHALWWYLQCPLLLSLHPSLENQILTAIQACLVFWLPHLASRSFLGQWLSCVYFCQVQK